MSPESTDPSKMLEELEELRKRVRELEASSHKSDAEKDAAKIAEALAEKVPVMLWESDVDGQCTFFNEPWLAFRGRTLEEESVNGWLDGVHPLDKASCVQSTHDALETKQEFRIAYRLRKHDGEYAWILDTGAPRLSRDGEFVGFSGACVDVTELKEVGANLISYKEFVHELAELSASEGMPFVERCRQMLALGCRHLGMDTGVLCQVHGDELRVIVCFSTLDDEISKSEVLQRGKPFYDATMHSHDALMFERVTGTEWEKLVPRREGSIEAYAGTPIRLNGHVCGALSFSNATPRSTPFADIDKELIRLIATWVSTVLAGEKREAEYQKLLERVQHKQTDESLGVLARSFARDFNPLLAAILGNAELAIQDVAPQSMLRQCLDDIAVSARSAIQKTKQLLIYIGSTQPSPGEASANRVQLNHVIAEMGQMFRATIHKRVQFRYDLLAGLPTITADSAQIRQLLINLVTNASEAIGEGQGKIALRTGVVRAETAGVAATFLEGAPPKGRCVLLEVTDTGKGMDEEISRRMFDPFYSTKNVGHGLGLAAVARIVKNHHGAIQIQSRVGEGTIVRVFLPSEDTSVGEMESPENGNGGAGWLITTPNHH